MRTHSLLFFVHFFRTRTAQGSDMHRHMSTRSNGFRYIDHNDQCKRSNQTVNSNRDQTVHSYRDQTVNSNREHSNVCNGWSSSVSFPRVSPSSVSSPASLIANMRVCTHSAHSNRTLNCYCHGILQGTACTNNPTCQSSAEETLHYFIQHRHYSHQVLVLHGEISRHTMYPLHYVGVEWWRHEDDCAAEFLDPFGHA